MDYYKLKVLNHKKIFIFIAIIIILLLLGYYYFYYENTNSIVMEKEEVSSATAISKDNSDIIYVDIKGHVIKPGVYSFKIDDDARINDLIIKAGGLQKDADTSILNLSKKLEDEMTIIIYSKSEVENYVKEQYSLSKKLEICEQKVKNNACINNNEINNNDKININIASKEDLEKIPGIGSNKAESIINYRNSNTFKSIEDIKNVDGIGDSLFESIKEHITI